MTAAMMFRLRRRRILTLFATLAIPTTLQLVFGHRGAHMVRDLLVPGSGLIDQHRLVGLAFVAAAIAATAAWVKWGMDWSVVLVVVSAMMASAFLTRPGAQSSLVVRLRVVWSAHEFPLVLLVVGAFSWCRSVAGRVPFVGRVGGLRRRRIGGGLDDLSLLAPVDRCRVVALLALASDRDVETSAWECILTPDVERRARRIGFVARGRRGGDAFRGDHAPARAALALTGAMDQRALNRFRTDAERSALGVPCTEPGWVRPFDATLAAISLHSTGPASSSKWAAALCREFALRRGHRPAWWWTPLGIGAGSMPPWEQAACTGLARSMGWLGDEDWVALRAQSLGASAKGTRDPHDERLIAAARLWLVFVDDPVAARLLARPTIRHDPIAVALDLVAQRLSRDPETLFNIRTKERCQ